AGRWPATALTRPQGCRPAAGTTVASAQRFGHRAEDRLHLLRLEQAVDALPRFPWGNPGPVVPAAGRQPR
ncbi:hypothetical protein D1178_21640, partial [Stenotrophomonas maltophilia]